MRHDAELGWFPSHANSGVGRNERTLAFVFRVRARLFPISS